MVLQYPVDGSNLSFNDLCYEAIRLNEPIVITKQCHIIIDMIFLKTNNTLLHIIGNYGTTAANTDDRSTIECASHSIFKCGGKHATIHLENVKLLHTCKSQRDVKADVGSCVFGMHKSCIILSNCSLISQNGFAIWAVQRSKIICCDSLLVSINRSGCVVFGRSNIELKKCIFTDCNVHSVCVRGDAKVSLIDCELKNSTVRCIYAYHRAKLSMLRCSVTGTRCVQHAAIDISASSRASASASIGSKSNGDPPAAVAAGNATTKRGKKIINLDSLTVSIVNCIISNNSGMAIRIKQCHDSYIIKVIDGCTIENNLIDDIVICSDHKDLESEDDASDGGMDDGAGGSKQVQWLFEVDDSKSSHDHPVVSADSTYNRRGNMTGKLDGWQEYNSIDNTFIETMYAQIGTSSCVPFALPIPHEQYEVSLATMMQTNTQTFYLRAIKRVYI